MAENAGVMTSKINFAQAKISKEISEYLGLLEPSSDQRIQALVADAFAKTPSFIIPQEKHSTIKKLSPKQVFQGLGKDWWMLFIDGYLHGHKYGKMVFDYERPDHPAEKGFSESIYYAYVLASDFLEKFPDQPLTVEFYKEIHKTACAHFDGKSTQMTSEHAGVFWRASSSEGNLRHLFSNMSDSELKKIKDDAALVAAQIGETSEEVSAARATIDELSTQVKDKIKQLNNEIAVRSAKLGIPPVAEFKLENESYPWTNRIIYRCKDVKTVVKRLFEDFSKAIAQAQSNDDIDEAIANLFQMLEWVHPFRDGQGRTDLVLLATLLSKYGRNPPILYFPYYSTYHSFKEWVKYLQEGMEKWRTKFLNPNRAGMIPIQHLSVVTGSRPSSTRMNGAPLNRQPLRLGLKDSLFG